MASGNWTDYAATSFAGGSGTSSSPYQIATAAQLAYFAKVVNNSGSSSTYRGKYYVLTANIDLSAHYWIPIGTDSSYYFSGYFDGKNYTVSNMNISSTASYLGFFGYTYQPSSAYIKNVKFVNPIIKRTTTSSSSNNCTGVLIGRNARYVNASNIYISNLDISGTYNYYTGGLIGYISGGYQTAISNIYINGGNISSVNYTGGLIGSTASTTGSTFKYINIILNSIQSQTGIGGVIGYYSNSYVIDISQTTVSIHTPSLQGGTASNNGGIVGNVNSSGSCRIDECVVNYWGGNSSSYVLGKNITTSSAYTAYYNTDNVSTSNVAKDTSGVTSNSFSKTRGASWLNPDLSMATFGEIYAYGLGTSWAMIDGDILYINEPFKTLYPNVKPYYLIRMVDWYSIYSDNMVLYIYTNQTDFTIPSPSNYGYASVSMELYNFNTKRADGTASSTGTYMSPGDTIYNIDQDYSFDDMSYDSGKVIKYKKDSSTIVDVLSIYQKNSSNNVVKVTKYITK